MFSQISRILFYPGYPPVFTGYIKFEYYTTTKRAYLTVTIFFKEIILFYICLCVLVTVKQIFLYIMLMRPWYQWPAG